MKLSKYIVDTVIDDKNSIIYSTSNKKYFVYDTKKHDEIWELVNNLNKSQYDNDEVSIIKNLISKGIVLKDNINELDILEFNENKDKYSDQVFNLMIIPTMDCNFRCVYCYEEHKKQYMDLDTADKVLAFISKNVPRVKRLRVAWFGGEPLMGLDTIKYLTKKINSICDENNVKYSAMMTSNAYLFNEEIVSQMSDLKIDCVQITVDGMREYHNKKRPHVNGENTFDVIMKNIILLLKNNISITFRINIDENNKNHIEEIFDIIPKQLRKKVKVDICNLYQNEKKINTYKYFKTAIEKGYKYIFKNNRYINCEVCKKNGLVIAPDGKAIPCTAKAEKGYEFGCISENGVFQLKNEELYYKLKTASVLKRESCKDCSKLPLCIVQCKFKVIENVDNCMGIDLHGMCLEDIVKLHYYSDLADHDN